MSYHPRKFKKGFAPIMMAASFGLAYFAYGAEVTLTAKYQGGSLDGQTPVSGLTANADVRLSAQFTGDQSTCTGSLGYTLWRTMVHAKDGDADNRTAGNLEYLARGAAKETSGVAAFSYEFNSGSADQNNVYWPVFYCWSADAPATALSTAQQWSGTVFDQDTVGGACTFSNPSWSTGSPKVGDMVTMKVSGNTLGCQGQSFSFEVWGGSVGCKSLANRLAETVASSFPSSGATPFQATGSWKVPDDKEYCFKMKLPASVNDCARTANDLCLWSGALRASAGGGGRDGDGRTTSASLEFRNPLSANDLRELIDALVIWIFWLSIPIAVIMIVYAGFQMLISGGDAAKFSHGKKILLWAVIGLTVVFIGEGFITLIESILDLGK